MSVIVYLLSNAQRKELLVRGRSLNLALPAPPVEVRDPLDWARSVLPSDLRQHVRSAEQVELSVRPRPRAVAETLTDVIGEIADHGQHRWTYQVVAIVVALVPPNARNGEMPVQWPANVTIDGSILLEPRDGEKKAK